MCVVLAVGFEDGLKKRKAEEPVTEATPSLQSLPMLIENTEPIEAEVQETGNEEKNETKKEDEKRENNFRRNTF